MFSSRTTVVLDRIIETGSNLSYNLHLNIPKANRDPAYTGVDTSQLVTDETESEDIRVSFVESSNVTNISYSGNKSVLTVGSAYSEQYIGGQWVLEATHPTSGVVYGAKKYRILSLRETDDKNITVTALEYDSGKFDISESDIQLRRILRRITALSTQLLLLALH